MDTRPTNQAIDCRFFGTEQRQLFGIYEPPSGGAPRRCAVVLCYPFSREYIRCHRAYRQLSQRLSSAGFPVLRFDYYGTGDSAGESNEGSIEGWTDDIASAVQEVTRRSGRSAICLVGTRLGGSMAVQAAASLDRVKYLALWEPVICGRDYLAELIQQHQSLLRARAAAPIKQLLSGDEGLLGFPLTESLLAELESIDLSQLNNQPAEQVLVIESNANGSLPEFVRALEGTDARCQLQRQPSPEIWKDDEQALVPLNVIQAIVDWISGVTS